MSSPPSTCKLRFGPRFVGDPVDVVTGEVRDIATDFVIDGHRPLVWERHHQGFRRREDRGLGLGHRHCLDWFLHIDLDGTTLHTPSDSIDLGHLWSDGASEHRHGWTLRRASATRFVLTKAGQPTRTFERTTPGATQASLREITYGDGGRTQLQYRGPNLISVVDTQGWMLRLWWKDSHIERIQATGSFGDLGVIRYRYDDRGRLIAGTDAYQQTFKWQYGDDDLVARRIDRRGYGFVYQYDDLGRCTRAAGDDDVDAVSFEYDPEAFQTTVTHETNGAQWTYGYGQGDELLEVVGPEGSVQQYVYDPTGRRIEEIDPAGDTWSTLFDVDGQATAKIDPWGHRHEFNEDPARPSRPLQRRTWLPVAPSVHEFGKLGGLGYDVPRQSSLQQAVPGPFVPAFIGVEYVGRDRDRFDAQGLKLGCDRTFGNGHVVSQRRSYDPNGNLRRYVDFDGSRWEFEYRSWNQWSAMTDPLGGKIELEHDGRDCMVAVTDAGGTSSRYSWDLHDRLSEVRRHGKLRERYQYNAAGHLLEIQDAQANARVSFERGATGTLLRRESCDGVIESFTRDSRGHVLLASSSDPWGGTSVVEQFHDERGRCLLDQRDGIGISHAMVGPRLVSTRFEIPIAEDEPPRAFEVRYEAILEGVALKRGTAVIDPTGRRHQLQTLTRGVFARSFAHGVVELSQVDGRGQCLGKATRNDREVWLRRFKRSGEGDLLRRDDSRRGTTNYEYDAAHQLTKCTQADGTEHQYKHDPAGNLRLKPGLAEQNIALSKGKGPQVRVDPVSLIAGNRLRKANGDLFEYDARDHIAVRRGPRTEVRYVRDGFDRLRRIEHVKDGKPPLTVWEAHYDALGRRCRSFEHTPEGPRETKLYWDRDRLAAEILPEGQLRIYVYSDRAARVPMLFVEYKSVDADPKDGAIYTVHCDHRGAVERIDDEHRTIVWEAEIGPYGEVEVLTGPDFHQPFGLIGQYRDTATGLHHHLHRNWSPELGRFLESDPAGLAGGINLYAWPGCPSTVADPLGLGCGEDGDAESGADSEGLIGRPQSIQDRMAAIADPDNDTTGSVPSYARRDPDSYYFDQDSGSYRRRPGSDGRRPPPVVPFDDWAEPGSLQRDSHGPLVADSRAAAARAFDAESERGCMAADGPDSPLTESGFRRPPQDGVERVSPAAVRDANPDHALRNGGANDQPTLRGGAADPDHFQGRAAASHAEKQQAARGHDAIGVDRDMCGCCRGYMSSLAQRDGRDIAVTDGSVTRVFNSDGSVTTYAPDGSVSHSPSGG